MRSEVVDINRLSTAELDALAAECRPVFERVFATLGDKDYVRVLFGSKTRVNRIKIFRDEHDRVIGFLGFAVFDLVVDGKACRVIRGPMGFDPDHQGRGAASSPFSFYFFEGLRYFFSDPLQRLYYVNNTIGPQAYQMNAKNTYRGYPSPRFPQYPPFEQALVDACTARFHWGPADPGHPHTRKMALGASIAPARLDTSKPFVRFFLHENPHYYEGYGLPHVVPFTLDNIVLSTLLFAGNTLKRSARLLRGRLGQTKGARP